MSQLKKLSCLATLVGVVIVVLTVAGCGSSGSGTSGDSNGSGSGGHKTVAMLAGLANPFQSDIKRGAEDVAHANNATIKYYNYNNNSQTEASDVSNIITSKPDLVLYGVSDSQVSLANFRRLKQAGIPVVCFDVCLDESVQQQYAHGLVTSDNVELGKLTGHVAAAYINSKLGGQATVAYITCNSEAVCRTRYAAQQSALASVKLTAVGNQVAIDPGQVKSTAEGMLQAHPDLDMIITDGLPQTEGGTAAISNLKRKTVLFGMDITPAIARDLLVSNGPLQAAVGQDGVKIGSLAMNMGLGVLADKEPPKFEVTVPGKLYERKNPAAVKAYLAATSG